MRRGSCKGDRLSRVVPGGWVLAGLGKWVKFWQSYVRRGGRGWKGMQGCLRLLVCEEKWWSALARRPGCVRMCDEGENGVRMHCLRTCVRPEIAIGALDGSQLRGPYALKIA